MRRLVSALITVMLLSAGCSSASLITQENSVPEPKPAPADVPPVPREPFRGQFGGVSFQAAVSADDLGCPASEPVDELPVEAVSSPLLFDARFLEPAFSLTGGNRVAVCGGRAISYAVRAVGSKGELSIARFGGAAVVTDQPLATFSQVTVGSKPAVLIQNPALPGAPPPGDDPLRWRLVVKEAFGVTLWEARGLTRGELLALAERLP